MNYYLRYLKTGATPEETMYLSKYAQTIDGAVSGCTDGNWILRQADPKKDYIQLEAAGPMTAWICRRVVCRFVFSMFFCAIEVVMIGSGELYDCHLLFSSD